VFIELTRYDSNKEKVTAYVAIDAIAEIIPATEQGDTVGTWITFRGEFFKTQYIELPHTVMDYIKDVRT
jgi:hypothetical protein